MLRSLAQSLDSSPQTTNHYLDLLCDAFITRRLLSWRANVGERLVLLGQSRPIGVEVKYSSAPKPSKGFWHALDDLDIERAFVIYPGKDNYPLDRRVTVWPAADIPKLAGLMS